MTELQSIRQARGYSQEYMARHFNVSLSTWRRYEKLRADPPADLRNAIADYLEVSLDQLAGRSDFNATEAVAV